MPFIQQAIPTPGAPYYGGNAAGFDTVPGAGVSVGTDFDENLVVTRGEFAVVPDDEAVSVTIDVEAAQDDSQSTITVYGAPGGGLTLTPTDTYIATITIPPRRRAVRAVIPVAEGAPPPGDVEPPFEALDTDAVTVTVWPALA
jgi:hypothetical protein